MIMNIYGNPFINFKFPFQGLSTQVSFILDILSQHRTAMRQQYDEVDVIRSQVERLQEQSASIPWQLSQFLQPVAPLQSNFPAQDTNKEEKDPPDQN
jgi:hypothetical protein